MAKNRLPHRTSRTRIQNFTQKGHPAIRILKLNHDERNRERREKMFVKREGVPETIAGLVKQNTGMSTETLMKDTKKEKSKKRKSILKKGM